MSVKVLLTASSGSHGFDDVLQAIHVPLSSTISVAWSRLCYHGRTLLLFTLTDLKTIFVPISAFACATGPLHSYSRLPLAWSWIWLHQFMCNVSNQARGSEEDAINKPWRPLPAGRVTQAQAIALRWVAVGLCVWYSALFGSDLVLATLGLALTTFLYDDLGLAGHYAGKNFCNIGGYTTFEIGATKLMGATRDLDRVSTMAVVVSGVLIFTTIQAQDFADTDGDKKLGRVTFPIYAPELSRVVTLLALPAWSIFLSCFWSLGPLCSGVFVAAGLAIGCRFYLRRLPDEDNFSYILFNIWLSFAHIAPYNARGGCFNF